MNNLSYSCRDAAVFDATLQKIDRIFKIMPQASGSLLIVSTLPRMTSMGLDASLDSKDFFEIAALIEAAL